MGAESLKERLKRASTKLSKLNENIDFKSDGESIGCRLVVVNDSFLIILSSTADLYALDLRPTSSNDDLIKLKTNNPIPSKSHSLILSPSNKLLAIYSDSNAVVVVLELSRISRNATTCILNVIPFGSTLFAQRPGLKISQLSWHYASEGHMVLLTSDGRLRIFDTSRSLETEEQSLDTKLGEQSLPAISFAYGAHNRGWDSFSLYCLNSLGELYVICPFAPFGITVAGALIRDLRDSALQTLYQEGSDEFESSNNMPMQDSSSANSTLDSSRRRLSFGSPSHTNLSLKQSKAASWSATQAQWQLRWIEESFGEDAGLNPEEESEGYDEIQSRLVMFKSLSMGKMRPLAQGPCFLGDNSDLEVSSLVGATTIELLENPPGVPLLVATKPKESEIGIVVVSEVPKAAWEFLDVDRSDHVASGLEVAPEMVAFERLKMGCGRGLQLCTSARSRWEREVWNVRDRFVVYSEQGVWNVSMPWCSYLADDDAASLSNAPPSKLSCILATTRHPLAVCPTALSQQGLSVVVLTAEWEISVFQWRRASETSLSPLPDIGESENLSSNLLPNTPFSFHEFSIDTEDSESLLQQSGFEKSVLSALSELERLPKTAFLASAVKDQTTLSGVLHFLQSNLEKVQEANAHSLLKLQSVLKKQAETSVHRGEQHLKQLNTTQDTISEVDVENQRLALKLVQARESTSLLNLRITRIIERATRLSDKNTKLRDEAFQKGLANQKQVSDSLRVSVDEIMLATKHQITKLSQERTRQSSLSLPTHDQTRIHNALSEHGIQLARQLDQSAQLWTRLDALSHLH